MSEIRIVELEKRYGAVVALRGISATVRSGDLLALLGPSGCGKTTTLQLLAGFAAPDGGQIWLGDRLLSSPAQTVPPEKRNMSLVFQSYALWPHMTVADNVAFGLQLRKLPRDEIRRRVARMLEVVNLGGYQRRYPHELSGGQQQRVALARALVVEPDTLLLDEPLSNLDANLREQMRFEIRRIHDETGITTVYVTHDQAEAMVIADRIAVMHAGLIEQIGAPAEIYETPRSRFVASFIGQTNCLEGELVEPGLVRCGDLLLRAGDCAEEFKSGDAVVLCVRPYAVEVGCAADGVNVIDGRLLQQAYLGDLRDLELELTNGTRLRALVPSSQAFPPGQDVRVMLPVESCRVVRP